MTFDAPTVGLAALAGLALGSYAVTAAVRFARAEPSAVGRSHCDHCGQSLSFAQTIPVISYIQTRGACGVCRARIDPVHIVGELSGLVVLLTALRVAEPIRIPLLSVLGLLLLAASVIDWKIGRLPNFLTGSVAVVAVLLAALKSRGALEAGLVASTLTFFLLMGVRSVSAKTRADRDPGIGLGDVKLLCAVALWIGATTSWVLIVANVSVLVLVKLARLSPRLVRTGPALAAAAWIVGMGGEWGYWPTTISL